MLLKIMAVIELLFQGDIELKLFIELSLYDFVIDYDPTEELREQEQQGQQQVLTNLLEGLNPSQRQAVEQTQGPVLVLAGAGTGKTRVLTSRMAYIIHTQQIFPSQILAVTFTNKAAQEMKERVSALMGGAPMDGWWLGTFHSLAARMLRRHADLIGLNSNFTILDTDDQIRLIKQIFTERNIDPKKNTPKVMASIIGAWKDKAKTPQDVLPADVSDFADGQSLDVYRDYQSRLKTINACDFGDLLLHVITILKDPNHAHILGEYHNRFRYIMVDEYQDTNVSQYLWLKLLAQNPHNTQGSNICCVGDDDQSIYGWRGAEVDNILRFEQDFAGAQVIKLEENYRSTGHILNAANAVIKQNSKRLGKDLFTSIGEGEKVTVRALWDGAAEARWIGEEVESLQTKNYNLGQMAVLVRAGFQMRSFEERFVQLGLNYVVIGGPRFYERMEIRDALAYLRVVAQPQDDLALERVINTPKRGIGDSTVKALHHHARLKGISLYQSIQDLTQTSELRPKVRTTLMALYDQFERWRSMVDSTNHADLAALILEEAGYIAMWKADKSIEAPGRLENLEEFISAMRDFDSLAAFLEHIALVLDTQDQNDGNHITLMTLHGAKGLEFDVAFLPGWEDGLFPSQRSMDENGLKGLEEERRLAYVGITRAKKKAYISYVANRQMYGNWVNALPSRFIEELPPEHIHAFSDSGLHMAGRSAHWDSSGWKDRQEQPATMGRILEKVQKASADGSLMMGDIVFHQKFGQGKIVYIDGQKLDILFDHAGQKRVMDSFVEKV